MLTWLDRPDGKTVEIIVDGKVEGHEYDETILHLKGKIQEWGKINIVEFVKNYDGFQPEVLWDNIKFGMDHFKDIEKCAIVTNNTWLRLASELTDPLVRMEIKTFKPEQIEEARDWCAESSLTPPPQKSASSLETAGP